MPQILELQAWQCSGLFSPAGSAWCCVALSIGVRTFWQPSAGRLSFGYAVDNDGLYESWIV